MRPWNPPAALPRVRHDERTPFLGQFDPARITRRDRSLLTDALRAGLVSPEDLATRLGIAVCTANEWAGLERAAEIRPDLERRAWLASQGLRTQALATAELLAQESPLIVSHRAIERSLCSKARSKIVPVLMHRVREALPEIRIQNMSGVGFRWTSDLPWEEVVP